MRLRSFLLLTNFFIVALAILALFGFKMFEEESLLQTESELSMQASFATALVRAEISKHHPGLSVSKETREIKSAGERLSLSVRPAAESTSKAANPLLIEIGKQLTPLLSEVSRKTLATVMVTDENGIVVTGENELGRSLANLEEVQAALRGYEQRSVRERVTKSMSYPLTSISRNSSITCYLALPIVSDDRIIGSVLLSRTPKSILKFLYERRFSVAIVGIIISLLVWCESFGISRAIGRPLERLLLAIKDFERSGIPVPKRKDSPIVEIDQLSQTVSSMSDKLNDRQEYLQNFAQTLSHEFKSPLTSIQGALELIEEDAAMSVEEKNRFLQNIREDVQRLKKLLTGLLSLAYAESVRQKARSCDLHAMLSEAKKRFFQRGLAVVIEGECKEIIVNVPEEAIDTILNNLLENSKQAGADMARIVVRKDDETVHLNVIDNGRGVENGNLRNIMTPFFTTKRDNGGTGLGLSIVRSLLNSYRGEIEVGEQKNGFEVRLKLPVT